MLHYNWYTYQELDKDLLYDLLYLRQRVFVQEQNCPYAEIDGLDRDAWHLIGTDTSSKVVAYLRLLPPGIKYDDPSLGRVIADPSIRGTGVGRELMVRGIAKAEELFPDQNIRLSAQVYAQGFYQSVGFEPEGEPYDDEGILHIDMVKRHVS